MANVNEAAVQAIELDSFAQDIPDIIFEGTTLYSLFKKKSETQPISNASAAGGVTRPAWRIDMRIQAGSAFSQGTGDGDAIPTPSGSQYVGMALSPIWFQNACAVTTLANLATKTKDRGLFQIQTKELQSSLTAFTQGLESALNSDGAGTLDIIPSTATVNNGSGSGVQTSSIVGLNVAARFQDQQTITVYPSIGGSARGSFTISYVDPVAETIYSSGALPSGTTTGDYLMISGASGDAGTSLLGLKAWQNNTNVGTIGGLTRANFPGRLSCPTINLDGGSVTPGLANRALVLLGLALGPDNKAIDSAEWYTAAQQASAIADNTYYNTLVTGNVESQAKATAVPDVAKQYFQKTFGGRPLHASWTADTNRLDLVVFDNFKLGELVAPQLHDYTGTGMTSMPVIASGAYTNAVQFSYETGFALADQNIKGGLYVQNAAVPSL